MYWPCRKTIMISRCFWDYYLHVFQKDYAYELKNRHGVDVIWVDRPTRHPMIWFKQRKRVIDGITVLRPWALQNEYEKFNPFDCKVWDLQISKYFRKEHSTALWSICCTHPWLAEKRAFSHKIYWPGDHFEPVDEYKSYKDYDVVMPWVGIDQIPNKYKGRKFLSSTCAGSEFMNYHETGLLNRRLECSSKYKSKVCYIGGLSLDRFDFTLFERIVSSMPETAFLLGVKLDGHSNTEVAKDSLLRKYSNVKIFEDLNYLELAELVFKSDVGIIPYKISGQNLRICPNKFFEYSALGKRTVTTAIPAMARYSPPAIIAQNHEQFVNLLKKQFTQPIGKSEATELVEIAKSASAKQSLLRLADTLKNS